MSAKRWWLVFVLVLAGGCACKKDEAAAPAPEEAEEDVHRPLELSADAIARAGIRTAPVKKVVLASTVVLTGEVVAPPDRSARLSSATPGRLEQVSFNEGQVVKRGDLMATLRVPDVGRLRGAFAASSARAKAARANAERFSELKKSGLGAEQSLIDAEADARAQEAEARALGEQLAAIGVNADTGSGFLVALRAPLSGVVVMRDAVVGQPIDAEHVLASIVDLAEVWFLARVFEKDLSKLRVGAQADVQLNALPGKHFAGTVEYVSQQLDPKARTLTARIKVANPDQELRLGLFGRARIELDEPGTAAPQLTVDHDALVDIGGKTAVFVKDAAGQFHMREVQTGQSALGEVALLSGVAEGEEVVISGVFTLKSLLLKASLAEEE